MFASLAEYYGSRIADMYNLSALQPRDQVEAFLKNKEICIYAGHFSYGLHEWLSRPSYYAAIVRHPNERIESLYNYSIQYRDEVRAARKVGERSFEEVFADGHAADFYYDYLPWIKGQQTISAFLNCPSPELDNGMVRRFSGHGISAEPCPAQALEQAKHNIETHYSVVGLLERYPESLTAIRQAFNLNLSAFHVNKGSKPAKKSARFRPDVRRRIKAMNKLDIALYEWVEKRFDQSKNAHLKPIVVEGQGRTDIENANLWHAIGNSPIRQAVMANSPEKHKPV